MPGSSAHLAKLASDVYSVRIKAAICFKQEHFSTITDYNFKLGDLVLIRNTAIEKSLNCKMRARYIGPLIVISRNKGGAYIISELNRSVFDRPIAAFCVIPYFAWQCINVLPLDELIDITSRWLCKLEETTLSDLDDEDKDVTANWYPSPDEDNEEDWGQSIFQLGWEVRTNFIFQIFHFRALRFHSFSQLSFLHLRHGYNLVCRKRGFTGNEAFWAFPLLKYLLFLFWTTNFWLKVVFSLYWHVLQRSKIRDSKDLIF